MTLPKKLRDARLALSDDESALCICAGPTCSGCETINKKQIAKGFDACWEQVGPELEALKRTLKNSDDEFGLIGGMTTDKMVTKRINADTGIVDEIRQALARLEEFLK
jgi:hypothetical protein